MLFSLRHVLGPFSAWGITSYPLRLSNKKSLFLLSPLLLLPSFFLSGFLIDPDTDECMLLAVLSLFMVHSLPLISEITKVQTTSLTTPNPNVQQQTTKVLMQLVRE